MKCSISLRPRRARRAPPRALLPLGAVLVLTACVPFSKDGGFDQVAADTRARLGAQVRWPRNEAERAATDAAVATLLARPLSSDEAVQVALLNSPALQAVFEDLGISETDLVQASRLPNPGFTLRHAAGSGQSDIEEILSIDVLALATRPFAIDIGKRRFAEARERATLAVMRMAARTRRAYFDAVAAAESARYFELVHAAAESGAELARRMRAAGNWSLADEARERGFGTEASQRLAAARLEEQLTRESLTRLLGLGAGAPPLRIAERLPDLPASPGRAPADDARMLGDRIDLKIESHRLGELAHELGLVEATRFVSVLDAGPARVREGPSPLPYEHGYEVRLELPLFDGGGARVRRAQARYSQAADRYAQAVVDAISEARAADAACRAAFEIAALQRDETVPRMREIAADGLKRYYASQLSIFDLLSEARAQIGSAAAYIRNLRDFWIARTNLDAALAGGDARVDP